MNVAWVTNRKAWRERVETLGIRRSVFHCSHRTDRAFAAITETQRRVIIPLLRAQLHGDEKTALDFGCGWGRWTEEVAAVSGCYVLGVDLLSEYVEEAERRKIPGAPVAFLVLKGVRLPCADNSMDLVWVCMVLSAFVDDALFAETIQELGRVLRVGGLLFIVTTTVEKGEVSKGRWAKHRTVDELKTAFAKVAPLTVIGSYTDLKDKDSVLAGRKA